ncbi:MAG: helix-turn-helix domain-containing protein [Deltaproteobacteria bacterium]|nr:helix-turn-helix domain-containing protein [Deltaproteobacteria bacterium]
MKKEKFEELLESVRQGGAILKGKRKPSRSFNLKNPNVKHIRGGLGLSQDQFAQLIGINVGTLRNWEQGRRFPKGPARVLLGIVAVHPDALVDVVGITVKPKSKKLYSKLVA